jgi:hypothetical protein
VARKLKLEKLRRITKAEDPLAYKRRQFTTASPGKFRKSSKRVPYNQVQKLQGGGKSKERQIKERRAQPGYHNPQALKAMKTRALRREMNEYRAKYAEADPREEKIIKKYLDDPADYENWDDKDKDIFRNLFQRYPDGDIVRKWLGSSEKSRQIRRDFNYAKRAA